jgi:hypothetical protein
MQSPLKFKNKLILILLLLQVMADVDCQKANTAPALSGVAALTVVNALPTLDQFVTPIINTGSPIMWFYTANSIYYGGYYEYSPIAGNDTVYIVQDYDTLDVGPKAPGQMFYGILTLKKEGIYSLFLCGADTASPDYLLTTDTLSFHSPADSALGIRFVNLSAGSNPLSINLEGSPNGSEVGNLPYKGITGFKNYACNSSVTSYTFVIRDEGTGDSLGQYTISGNPNNGNLLVDPNGLSLVFKNVTIAVYGSETNFNFPLSTMLIDDY